ncbi:MAG: L,D-transpeptidase [Chlamydiales bacterium]|nr:L,D-transpeptidase [Chlamydiales bacterium]
MNFPRILLIGSASLFILMGTVAVVKKQRNNQTTNKIVDVDSLKKEISLPPPQKEQIITKAPVLIPPVEKRKEIKRLLVEDGTAQVDRIDELFNIGPNKLPIVETITYTSRVSWLKGRPAWIADYASNYKTSRHFIARSLNKKTDYITQKVAPGDRFNVLRSDLNFEFYFLVDISKCTMSFYYIDLDKNERVLLKTYRVGLGLLDEKSHSGTITPTGKFYLGDKIAIYKPGMMGFFQNERIEMINVFGSRWLPFKGIEEDQESYVHGYGIHGAPMYFNEKTGELEEKRDSIGKYESSGCIRLLQEDMEEIFAIVITRPTIVEIVKDATLQPQ